MAEEPPGFVHHENLERRGQRRVVDGGVGPMKDVEQQRLQDLRDTYPCPRNQTSGSGRTSGCLRRCQIARPYWPPSPTSQAGRAGCGRTMLESVKSRRWSARCHRGFRSAHRDRVLPEGHWYPPDSIRTLRKENRKCRFSVSGRQAKGVDRELSRLDAHAANRLPRRAG